MWLIELCYLNTLKSNVVEEINLTMSSIVYLLKCARYLKLEWAWNRIGTEEQHQNKSPTQSRNLSCTSLTKNIHNDCQNKNSCRSLFNNRARKSRCWEILDVRCLYAVLLWGAEFTSFPSFCLFLLKWHKLQLKNKSVTAMLSPDPGWAAAFAITLSVGYLRVCMCLSTQHEFIHCEDQPSSTTLYSTAFSVIIPGKKKHYVNV